MKAMTNANSESQAAATPSNFLREIITEDVRTKKNRGKVALPPTHRP
jgi:hypothetical protein